MPWFQEKNNTITNENNYERKEKTIKLKMNELFIFNLIFLNKLFSFFLNK